MSKVQTIVLAAGKGTRMKSDVPKVMHQVCGKPLILHVLDVVRSIGSLKTFVVLGHGIDQVKAILPSGNVAIEQKKLLGTADAVKSAARFLKNFKNDVVVLCGDTPLLRPKTIEKLISQHRQSKAVCTVLTAMVEDPKGYGRIVRNTKDFVVAIREEKDASEAEKEIREINVGIYCFRAPELLKFLPKIKVNALKGEYYLTDIIDLFAQNHFKVDALVTDDWKEGLGVNTRSDLASAQAVIRKRILDKLMENGVTIEDPATTYIAADVEIGQDTIIKPFTFIEENVVIGKKCVIGPFARLRPGTRLSNEVEIGNFTEVSRTHVGNKTLMKHFSFLGDARVGNNVNIGAGTVTANYDGKNKNITTIEDGAFIGSDSILVAPVSIGKKAMVGAGSVVPKNKNVPAGKIAVGIPARVIAKRKK
jgi:bifunctional UDP-N-acetylglucosamine pyrophosphorylase / glucosamine-1-phosphate N-acetyltransferase